jgi:hypothetical protein
MFLRHLLSNGNSGNLEISSLGAVRKPTVVVEPVRGLFHLDLQAVWHHRELLYFLIWRDVLAQDWEDLELIISDNASTDGTRDICLKNTARDRHVPYFRNERNMGMAWNKSGV